MSSEHKYTMSISLHALTHLGLNLYSNTPAVLAEVIANAWDADATEVRITVDTKKQEIIVADDGHGMSRDDINKKFLLVGYRKRGNRKKRSEDVKTPGGRSPMGRKGIGKLSLFSIAKKVYVYSKKRDADAEAEAFLMDADKIERAVKGEENKSGVYNPDPVEFCGEVSGEQGTTIKISELKKKVTKNSVVGFKKRIARRFGVIGDGNQPDGSRFDVLLNKEQITYVDRDYFHKARFLFEYGGVDYAQHCSNLDTYDSGEEKGRGIVVKRDASFDKHGHPVDGGKYSVSGWIAIARRSNDLDGKSDEHGDNLNNITIVVRGKVAQEDILHKYRLGGLITKFIYGEIHADFLDADREVDIATSGRQGIIEDDARYLALKAFVEKELKYIWGKTNELKDKKALKVALAYSSYINEWYNSLSKNLRSDAKKMFGVIERASMDEASKKDMYANGILAFEKLKLANAMKQLDIIDESNVSGLLEFFTEIDSIEAAHYWEIARERLRIIEILRDLTTANVKEATLQEFVFEHLWLLDPGWERATGEQQMEKHINGIVFNSLTQKATKKNMYIDIKYRRVTGAHVIVELKRAHIRLTKTDLEQQIRQYMDALEAHLRKTKEKNMHIEGVCIVGKLPAGWENSDTMRKEQESLRPLGIRVLTYDELVGNAHRAYKQYIEASAKAGKINELIEKIRNPDS